MAIFRFLSITWTIGFSDSTMAAPQVQRMIQLCAECSKSNVSLPPGQVLSWCSGCKSLPELRRIRYCSKTCQKAHWQKHKLECGQEALLGRAATFEDTPSRQGKFILIFFCSSYLPLTGINRLAAPTRRRSVALQAQVETLAAEEHPDFLYAVIANDSHVGVMTHSSNLSQRKYRDNLVALRKRVFKSQDRNDIAERTFARRHTLSSSWLY